MRGGIEGVSVVKVAIHCEGFGLVQLRACTAVIGVLLVVCWWLVTLLLENKQEENTGRRVSSHCHSFQTLSRLLRSEDLWFGVK